jgi:ElaA protein
MKLIVKKFGELTTKELYEILKLRSEIFVVEQNCVYQDIDNIDYDSLHFFYMDNNTVLVYLRVFYKNDEDGVVQIGRVVNREHGKGLGKKLFTESMKIIKDRFKANKMYLEAQVYAIGFYEKFGFKVISDEFLEDGIPHVKMMADLI